MFQNSVLWHLHWSDNSCYVRSSPMNYAVLQMLMEEIEIDQTQNVHISKMSNFTHYATSLRNFLTETIDMRFPRKFIISYNTKILDTVNLLYSHTIHRNSKVTVLRGVIVVII